jgi:hypothetical protein
VLRTNLATRPFYNDRAVKAGLAVLALLAAGLTVFNAVELLQLAGRNREARQTVARNAQQAREMRQKAQDIRRSINQTQLEIVQAQAREANTLIDQRAVSWTALLNHFQATLPPDVRIAGVMPQVDSSGRMLVAISVLSRRIDDLNEFIEALDTTGAFRDVLSRADSVDEDGTWHSELQAYYGQPAAGQAVPGPAASESDKPAPGNASAATVASAGDEPAAAKPPAKADVR